MKKLLALMMVLVLSLSLAACGTSGEDSESTDSSKDSNSSSESNGETSSTNNLSVGDEAIASRKASGEVPTIVMAFMNWAGKPASLERIEDVMSEYTIEKLGVKVQLEILDIASYSQSMTLSLSSGEHVDIFSPIVLGYTSAINKGYTLDLEEDGLIQTYGEGILETMNEAYVEACRVGGVLYGLPQQRDMAIGQGGFAIGAEYLDGIGFDYQSMYKDGEEVIYTDLATIEDIFTQMKETYTDMHVFAPSSTNLGQHNAYDPIGGDDFGVLVDPQNRLDVEDLWSSDLFRNFADRMYRWNQAGFISKDALTDDTAPTAQVKAGTAIAYATATKPGIKAQETGLCGRPMIIFQTGEDFLKSSAVSSMPWSINSGTEYPIASMQLLNMFYTDPYMSNLLCWGEEGVEYQKVDGDFITFADGIDASNSGYYNNVNWLMPNQFIAHVWEGNEADIWERMETFNNDSIKSKALGFAFDNSSVSTEYTALMNVYNEYGLQIIMGFADPAVAIPEMYDKLIASGLEIYMAAKQEALTEWAQVNGVE